MIGDGFTVSLRLINMERNMLIASSLEVINSCALQPESILQIIIENYGERK